MLQTLALREENRRGEVVAQPYGFPRDGTTQALDFTVRLAALRCGQF